MKLYLVCHVSMMSIEMLRLGLFYIPFIKPINGRCQFKWCLGRESSHDMIFRSTVGSAEKFYHVLSALENIRKAVIKGIGE